MTRPDFIRNEWILLETECDECIVVSGERVETETDPIFYPFTHAVTFRLCPQDAARLGQEVITVPETAILVDCQLPKATELPDTETAVTNQPTNQPTNEVRNPAAQLTLFGGTVETEQPPLFSHRRADHSQTTGCVQRGAQMPQISG